MDQLNDTNKPDVSESPSFARNRELCHFVVTGEGEDYIVIKESETLDKYVKGQRRRWHTEQISLTRTELAKIAKKYLGR